MAIAALFVLLGTSYDVINSKTTVFKKDQPVKCENGEVVNGGEIISKPKPKNSKSRIMIKFKIAITKRYMHFKLKYFE